MNAMPPPTAQGPLAGRCIAVTRAEAQAGEARQLLEQQGASVIDLPALVVTPPSDWGPLDDALADLETFHWLVFSSSNGVDAVDGRLRRLGRSLAHRPPTLRIAAVGRKTAARLDELGASADFVPPAFVADSLIEHFPCSAWGLRLLIPRVQSGGRTVLADAFAEAGARVVEVAAYDTACPIGLPSAAVSALDQGRIDALTFSSAKTVRHTAAMLEAAFGDQWRKLLEPHGPRPRAMALVSIGPQTSKACQTLMGRVDGEANPHDLEGLVAACVAVLGTELNPDRQG